MADMKRDTLRPLPRDLYLAAFARAVSMLGNVVAVTALLLDLHERGAGAWVVSGLLAAGTLPIIVLAPIIGLLIDRYDSRVLIIAIGLWQSMVTGLLAFVTHPAAVLGLVALSTLGTAVVNPLFGALTKVMVPDEQLAAANSIQQGGNVLATLAGPAVAGLLVGIAGGARLPVLLAAASFLMITGAGLLINTRLKPATEPTRPRVRDGITTLYADRALGAVVTLAMALTLFTYVIYVAQVFLIRDTFAASELTYGLLQAIWTVGLLVGTALSSRLGTVRRILLVAPLATVGIAVAFALIGLIASLPATFVLYVLTGAGTSVVSVSVGTLLLLRTPDSDIGLAVASYSAIQRSVGLLAYGLGGLVAGFFAPNVVYLLCGIATLVVALVLANTFRKAWLVN